MRRRERLPTEWVNYRIDTKTWTLFIDLTNAPTVETSQKECAGEAIISSVEDCATPMVKTSPDSLYASQNATQKKITFKPWYITQYGQDAYDKLRQDRKAYDKAYAAYRYKQNADAIKEQRKRYRQRNAEALKEKVNQYHRMPKGRAGHLANRYKQKDQQYNRQNNITADYIVNRIFTSKCYYCGESDWKKLGCDRIDNSIGHITTNVVCSCWDCNNERRKMPFREFCKRKGVA